MELMILILLTGDDAIVRTLLAIFGFFTISCTTTSTSIDSWLVPTNKATVGRLVNIFESVSNITIESCDERYVVRNLAGSWTIKDWFPIRLFALSPPGFFH